MSPTPKKLKQDAIAEAICEIRFECEESASLPELVIGKLAQFEAWNALERVRLPASEIPASIRAQDPAFRHRPIFEFRGNQEPKLVKFGFDVVSVHRVAPYPGWEGFKPEIDEAIDWLFASFAELSLTRLGFRYVNIFTANQHNVSNVGQLNYSVQIAGQPLNEPQNLNYRVARSDEHTVQVRIASPEFVTGPKETEVDVLVDLDVFTPNDWVSQDATAAKRWVEEAHSYEKEEFFKLFTPEMWEQLVEEQ